MAVKALPWTRASPLPARAMSIFALSSASIHLFVFSHRKHKNPNVELKELIERWERDKEHMEELIALVYPEYAGRDDLTLEEMQEIAGVEIQMDGGSEGNTEDEDPGSELYEARSHEIALRDGEETDHQGTLVGVNGPDDTKMELRILVKPEDSDDEIEYIPPGSKVDRPEDERSAFDRRPPIEDLDVDDYIEKISEDDLKRLRTFDRAELEELAKAPPFDGDQIEGMSGPVEVPVSDDSGQGSRPDAKKRKAEEEAGDDDWLGL